MTARSSGGRGGIIALRMVAAFAWLCLFELVAVWIAIAVLGDRAWWTVMLLFGPRWVLALPWFGVVPWLLADVRRAALPALAGAAIALFGVLGFHLGLRRADVATGTPFRVVELNAESGNGAKRIGAILSEFRDRQPDLIVIAECGPELVDALKELEGLNLRATDYRGLCLLSRGAILDWQQRDQRDVFQQGGAGYIVRALVTTPAGPVRVGLVHLATPRHALDSYFELHRIPEQGPNTRANLAQRDEESRFAREWIVQGKDVPTIIAGDFNLVVESAVYRRYWGDFRNAFGRAGFGIGNTKIQRLWGARIDHVLTSDDIGTSRAFVGRDVGSDHLPLITDLVLPKLAH